MNEIQGISSRQTQHIVFSASNPPSGPYKNQHGSQSNLLAYTKSDGAAVPSLHQQQWAVSLRDSLGFTESVKSDSTMTESTGATSVTIVSIQGSSATDQAIPLEASARTIQVATSTPKDKFALLKDVSAGQQGVSSGKFFDLAGEVIKMYYNSFGYLDLYLSDYTSNKHLHDYTKDSDASDGNSWRGPIGQMTLHVEIHQPHANWLQSNVKEGELVILNNVRVKWNQRGSGTELEGNMWPDKFYPDKVRVQPVHKSNPRYDDIMERKRTYQTRLNQERGSNSETKTSKKKKKKKRLEGHAQMETVKSAKRQKLIGGETSTILMQQSEDDVGDESEGQNRDTIPKKESHQSKSKTNKYGKKPSSIAVGDADLNKSDVHIQTYLFQVLTRSLKITNGGLLQGTESVLKLRLRT